MLLHRPGSGIGGNENDSIWIDFIGRLSPINKLLNGEVEPELVYLLQRNGLLRVGSIGKHQKEGDENFFHDVQNESEDGCQYSAPRRIVSQSVFVLPSIRLFHLWVLVMRKKDRPGIHYHYDTSDSSEVINYF